MWSGSRNLSAGFTTIAARRKVWFSKYFRQKSLKGTSAQGCSPQNHQRPGPAFSALTLRCSGLVLGRTGDLWGCYWLEVSHLGCCSSGSGCRWFERSAMILGLLIQIVAILAAARVGGIMAKRLRQPAVVGELTAGIVLGQFGFHWLKPNDALTALSQVGLILSSF